MVNAIVGVLTFTSFVPLAIGLGFSLHQPEPPAKKPHEVPWTSVEPPPVSEDEGVCLFAPPLGTIDTELDRFARAIRNWRSQQEQPDELEIAYCYQRTCRNSELSEELADVSFQQVLSQVNARAFWMLPPLSQKPEEASE